MYSSRVWARDLGTDILPFILKQLVKLNQYTLLGSGEIGKLKV